MSSPSLKRKGEGPLSSTDANKKPKGNASITSFFGPPKTGAGRNGPASSPSSSAADSGAATWDKAKWVATLTPEQKKYLALEIQTLHPSWLQHLRDEITSPEFIALKKFLDSELKSGKKVFPPREDVYSWSRHTPFGSVKAVIIGQDPYHNVNQAHGLCFSVRPPTPAPPSLKNMYIALRKDYPSFRPPPNNGGLLTPWAERGVLMLNTCLTVRAHEANSHAGKGWERFTQRVIDLVAQKRTRGVVFLAWGKPAASRVARVDPKRHLVLRSAHPSPLSASRGFFDCGHFRLANEWLAARHGPHAEIDWSLCPGTTTMTAKGEAADEEKKEKKKNEEEDAVVDEDEEEEMAKMEKAVAEEEEEKKKEEEETTPVVAVGEVDKETKEEKSAILEREGEDGAVDGQEETK
ncbi:uracil-DNA glycosylase-like protein [Biscogniauxia mediterranea]|nr:uracil-DNA glycosylase-like protein [Biscogniauxia mediterranea]